MMKTPHICPVCRGTGRVPQGFYPGPAYDVYAKLETCRTCWGSGVIWEEQPETDQSLRSKLDSLGEAAKTLMSML